MKHTFDSTRIKAVLKSCFWAIVTLTAPLLAFSAIAAEHSETRDSGSYNVLFIAIDDINDWIGCLGGNPQAITPNLDRFAREHAMVMNRAYCPSTVCCPTRSALLTGRHATYTGVYGNGQNLKDAPKAKDLETLPEYFGNRGYHTLSAGKIFHKHATLDGMDEGQWAFHEHVHPGGGNKGLKWKEKPEVEGVTAGGTEFVWSFHRSNGVSEPRLQSRLQRRPCPIEAALAHPSRAQQSRESPQRPQEELLAEEGSMKTALRPLLQACIGVAGLLAHVPTSHAATTYHVDALAGSDANSGLGPAEAWQSLAKVNGMTFQPGDRILFKSGTCHGGQLAPRGSGKLVDGKPNPIVIGRYGQGARPRIDGEGKVRSALYLYNVEYWEVSGLEITNTGTQQKPDRRGVHVHIKDFGTAHHIQLKDLYIHDVNGSIYKKKGGGGAILWQNEGERTISRFNGLLIENCHLKDCTRNGINARGYWKRDQWYANLNVVVRRCLLEGIPGDGIVPIACDGALIEHNVMRDCPRLLETGDAAAGIWPWSCDNTVIQFNEVSNHKAPWDAQGFDSDWNCRNTLIQYNYSHDNEGGFLLVCNNGGATPPANIGNQGTVVRYNISVNDGLRQATTHKGVFSPTFHISGPCKNTKIYNNVIYINRKPDINIDRTIVEMDNWGGPWPEDTVFANNIFFVEDAASFQFGQDKRTAFRNNVYYGKIDHRPDDSDPCLRNPRFGRQLNAVPDGFEALKPFIPQKGSPCIGAGLPIPDNGGRDFFGNLVPKDGPRCIGACESID